MIWAALKWLGWRGGVAIVAMLAVAVISVKLHNANNRIERLALELQAVTAERDQFRADAERMVQEGQERSQRAQEALREQEKASAVLKGQIGRLRAVRVPSGQECHTPKEVLESDL